MTHWERQAVVRTAINLEDFGDRDLAREFLSRRGFSEQEVAELMDGEE